MTFHKGKSGNPSGRPRGTRNKSTILLENVAHGDSEAVARMLTAMTKGGKIVSLRIRIQPEPAGQVRTTGEPPMAGVEEFNAYCISKRETRRFDCRAAIRLQRKYNGNGPVIS